MYKPGFYVPASHLKPVKEAVFATGAGRIGSYDRCCWQTFGQGQFRPLSGSKPYIGVPAELETVAEDRVEMACAASELQAVIVALKQAYPYEEPAWNLVGLVSAGGI